MKLLSSALPSLVQPSRAIPFGCSLGLFRDSVPTFGVWNRPLCLDTGSQPVPKEQPLAPPTAAVNCLGYQATGPAFVTTDIPQSPAQGKNPPLSPIPES